MRLLLLFVLLFLALSMDLSAQPQVKTAVVKKPTKDTIALRLDSSKTQVRDFNNEAIQKLKEDKAFQYGEEDAKRASWWDRFWWTFWRWIERLFGSRDGSSKPSIWPTVLKYSVIAICIGLVVFAVFKLAGIDLKWFSGKSKEVDVPYDESLENIHEISFEDELENALQNRNYRFAVRLLYLQTLKHLSDKEIIDWQPNKTNLAYVTEVQNEKGYEEFPQLTYQFEYIWYGDFKIDKSAYENIQQSFQQFNAQVK